MRHGIFKQAVSRVAFFTILTTFVFTLLVPSAGAIAGSDFVPGRIIDDHIFFDANTMGAPDIQAFLNSKVPVCDTWGTQPYGGGTRASYSASQGVSTPFTCLKEYQQEVPAKAADQYCIGGISAGTKSAAQIIKDVSVACSVSPKVLIVLLQKEQSLITDDWPWPKQYQKATGYGCPDTAACDPEFVGFFSQVYYAARQFQRYSVQSQLFNFRAGRTNFIQYNPNAGCSGTNVFIQNQASAGLYNYTPYQPNQAALNNLYGTGDGCSAYGNRNFWRLYSDWFGSPVTSSCFYNPPAQIVTDVSFRKIQRNVDSGVFLIYSGSSTNCIEVHTWNIGATSWASNLATNHPIALPANAQVLFGDLNGDGLDEPVLVGLNPTGSGMIEFHVWNRDMNKWSDHIISNLPASTLSNGKIVFADVNGDGRDEPVLILLSGTGSGMIEFHVWNNDMRSWMRQVPSQQPTIDMADGTVAFADLDGNGTDEPVLIGYRNQGSGRVEFHTWNADWRSWRFNTASNMPAIDPTGGFITFADIDSDRVDEAVLVGTKNTGSGRIELHTWQAGVTAWRFHTATNQQNF